MLCSNQLSYVATISVRDCCPEKARIFLILPGQVKRLRAWLLLRNAVNIAPPEQDLPTRHHNHLTLRKKPLQRIARNRVH